MRHLFQQILQKKKLFILTFFGRVLPKQYGVPKHPLFFLGFKKDVKMCKKEEMVMNEPETVSMDVAESVDEDVAEEMQVVNQSRSMASTQTYPLFIEHLRKVYPSSPPKVAVKDISLAIPRGQCFGLLGENGAGKTVTREI